MERRDYRLALKGQSSGEGIVGSLRQLFAYLVGAGAVNRPKLLVGEIGVVDAGVVRQIGTLQLRRGGDLFLGTAAQSIGVGKDCLRFERLEGEIGGHLCAHRADDVVPHGKLRGSAALAEQHKHCLLGSSPVCRLGLVSPRQQSDKGYGSDKYRKDDDKLDVSFHSASCFTMTVFSPLYSNSRRMRFLSECRPVESVCDRNTSVFHKRTRLMI